MRKDGMEKLKFWLIPVILSSWLIAGPALAVATSTTLTINNQSGYPDKDVYLVVWGNIPGGQAHLDLLTGALIPITKDDNTETVYQDDGTAYPDLYCNWWITLGQLPKNPDGSYSFTSPVIDSGRLYLSFRKPVYLHVNVPADPHAALAIRDVSDANIDDPSYKTIWDKFEWTLDGKGLHANVTPIDFTAIPLQFVMKRSGTPAPPDLGPMGFSVSRGTVTRHLNTNALLSPLRTPYRYYSPKAIDLTQAPITRPPITFPDNYFKPYVDWVWTNRWQTAASLKVAAGGHNWTGQISGGVLTLAPDDLTAEVHTISKPTQDWDIFACAGVFNIDTTTFTTQATRDRDGAIKNEIVSAINRGVLHRPTADWSKEGYYYTFAPAGLDPDPQTPALPEDKFRFNLYSQYLHQVAINHLIYGFPYDDKYDKASYLTDLNGTGLVLTINNCMDMVIMPPVLSLLLE
jgi:hypothetical protein